MCHNFMDFFSEYEKVFEITPEASKNIFMNEINMEESNENACKITVEAERFCTWSWKVSKENLYKKQYETGG